MRKLFSLLALTALLLALTACGGGQSSGNSGSAGSSDTSAGNSSSGSGSPAGSPEGSSPGSAGGSPVMVAFFSATGNTAGIAQILTDILDADSYEILPQEPYTEADLNYGDSQSRSSLEQNDPQARPAIAGEIPDLSGYDIVFLGYPIWWGEAPRILSTFVESCDLSGKTIVPFCTSGSSGFGSSDSALKAAAPSASWMEGRRFSAGTSQDEVLEWIRGLGLDLA